MIHERGTRTCEYPERIPLAASSTSSYESECVFANFTQYVVLQSARKEVSFVLSILQGLA